MSLEIQQPLILVKEQHISKAEAKANSAVRKVNAECSFCRRYNGRVMEQKMVDFPKERIVPDLPGTCRAVHLEVANSLETDACRNAL